MDPSSKKTHWVTYYDKYGDPTEDLIGSREGLLSLRAQIDEALEKGSAKTSGTVDFNFLEIKISDTHPRDVVDPKTVKTQVMKYGCLSILVLAFGFMCIGIYFVVSKFF